MRLAVAGFMHESNTFSPHVADRAAFEAHAYHRGEKIAAEWADAHHEVGGFLGSAAALGFTAVPLVMAWTTPAGIVAADAFDFVVADIVAALEREKPDGLLLALHGAMVAESYPDADAEILRRIRTAVGRDFPIAVTFDLHANIPSEVAQLVDIAVAYRTNPHVDQRECGEWAASLLVRALKGEIRPRLSIARPAMRINIMRQDTSLPPLADFMASAKDLESRPGVLAASLVPGFAYADVPHVGPSVLVVTDGDADLGQALADELAASLDANAARFAVSLPDARAAVAQALTIPNTPVVLVDTGDNVGGGSAGDGTVILRELLRQGATKSVVMLYAPGEVEVCAKAGVGTTVTLSVGGKVDDRHGEPVEVTGVLTLLHDGTYTEREVRHGGKRTNHMGPTALVELPGGNLLALTTMRHPPFSLGALTCLGIVPQRMGVIVVKAAIAYKAAYLPVAGHVIEVATPGLTAVL